MLSMTIKLTFYNYMLLQKKKAKIRLFSNSSIRVPILWSVSLQKLLNYNVTSFYRLSHLMTINDIRSNRKIKKNRGKNTPLPDHQLFLFLDKRLHFTFLSIQEQKRENPIICLESPRKPISLRLLNIGLGNRPQNSYLLQFFSPPLNPSSPDPSLTMSIVEIG